MIVTALDASVDSDLALETLLKLVYVGEGYTDTADAEAALSPAKVRERGVVLIARDDERVVIGTITVVTPSSPARRIAVQGEAEIHLLAVDPAFRGLGVGRALVEAAVTKARQDGAGRILLWTQPTMASAQRLYERCGFERMPELDFSRAGRDFLVFARSG